jgi:hypothetical protein
MHPSSMTSRTCRPRPDRTPDLVNAMNVDINDDVTLHRESFLLAVFSCFRAPEVSTSSMYVA